MTNPTKSHHAQYESFNLFFGGYKLEFILLLNKVGIYLMKYTGIRWSIIILTSTKPKPKTSSSVCWRYGWDSSNSSLHSLQFLFDIHLIGQKRVFRAYINRCDLRRALSTSWFFLSRFTRRKDEQNCASTTDAGSSACGNFFISAVFKGQPNIHQQAQHRVNELLWQSESYLQQGRSGEH